MSLFIDIETLPALNPLPRGSPAVNPAPSEENHLRTALNGDFGRLLCIGFIDESPHGEIESGVIGWDARAGAFHGDERIILAEFWRRMKSFRLGTVARTRPYVAQPPSLHTADVGISVVTGTDVAREAAEVILLERSLPTGFPSQQRRSDPSRAFMAFEK